MNIRKPADYSGLFTALDAVMAAELSQMELYFEIGRLVCGRPEKGAAGTCGGCGSSAAVMLIHQRSFSKP